MNPHERITFWKNKRDHHIKNCINCINFGIQQCQIVIQYEEKIRDIQGTLAWVREELNTLINAEEERMTLADIGQDRFMRKLEAFVREQL